MVARGFILIAVIYQKRVQTHTGIRHNILIRGIRQHILSYSCGKSGQAYSSSVLWTSSWRYSDMAQDKKETEQFYYSVKHSNNLFCFRKSCYTFLFCSTLKYRAWMNAHCVGWPFNLSGFFYYSRILSNIPSNFWLLIYWMYCVSPLGKTNSCLVFLGWSSEARAGLQ